jgi:hypothetical protein
MKKVFKHKEYVFSMRVHPSNYDLLFGLEKGETGENVFGIFQQTRAETLGLVG